ncbi:SEC-C metal-binding domain-containing protein, partial [Streptomyces phaeochromogenes]
CGSGRGYGECHGDAA